MLINRPTLTLVLVAAVTDFFDGQPAKERGEHSQHSNKLPWWFEVGTPSVAISDLPTPEQ